MGDPPARWANRRRASLIESSGAQRHRAGLHAFEDKTLFNERHLGELARSAQADVDAMQARYDQLARQVYMGDHSPTAANEMAALGPRLQAAKHSLGEYQAVQNAMRAPDDTPKRYLGFLDDQGNAAIPNLQAGNVSVTTWMDYDRPMSVLEQAPWPSYAQHGAGALDSFERGMRASHVGSPSVDTVIGHSYGTTLVGAAASGGHKLAADNIIAVFSPGMLVDHAGDLSINPGGTVFAMTDPHDPIGPANLFTQFTLGPDPTGPFFGAHNLYAGSGVGSGPPPPPPAGWRLHTETPTSQQQAQDTVFRYLKDTIKELPSRVVFDATRYCQGTWGTAQ